MCLVNRYRCCGDVSECRHVLAAFRWQLAVTLDFGRFWHLRCLESRKHLKDAGSAEVHQTEVRKDARGGKTGADGHFFEVGKLFGAGTTRTEAGRSGRGGKGARIVLFWHWQGLAAFGWQFAVTLDFGRFWHLRCLESRKHLKDAGSAEVHQTEVRKDARGGKTGADGHFFEVGKLFGAGTTRTEAGHSGRGGKGARFVISWHRLVVLAQYLANFAGGTASQSILDSQLCATNSCTLPTFWRIRLSTIYMFFLTRVCWLGLTCNGTGAWVAMTCLACGLIAHGIGGASATGVENPVQRIRGKYLRRHCRLGGGHTKFGRLVVLSVVVPFANAGTVVPRNPYAVSLMSGLGFHEPAIGVCCKRPGILEPKSEDFQPKVETVNVTSWASGPKYLRGTDAHIVCVQEHKLTPDKINAANDQILAAGWRAVWSPAILTAKGAPSCGAAVCVREGIGVRTKKIFTTQPHRVIVWLSCQAFHPYCSCRRTSALARA